MKILFVINNFYAVGNGLSASARRTTEFLTKAGHEVRILSGPNHNQNSPQPDYQLKDYKFPLVNFLVVANGYYYAQSNLPLMEEAARWADVIHLEEPFVIQDRMIKICERLGKPITATYHLHPENITMAFGPVIYWKGFNNFILGKWRDLTFNHCSHVQCPTQNVQDRLRGLHFTSELEYISNGITPSECLRPLTPPADYLDPERPFKVVCIGRLSAEKDQFTLLEAMKYSKYAKRIQLQFAGNGIKTNAVKKKAHKLFTDGILSYDPQFFFLDSRGLKELAAGADMCIHCAFIEVEGLSIMEAIQQAAMPIIAEGPITGTSQFAVSRKNVFPAKNPEALASRIDYWLDRPGERWESGFAHAERLEKFSMEKTISKLVRMFEKAIKAKKQ
ncbi:MAG: glycosyltransferase [Bacteroidales bacterium]|nr:glycosyltransferase [Bacteroidales bacterium]